MSSPASAPELAAAGAAELIASGSLEMGAHRPQDAAAIAALGTSPKSSNFSWKNLSILFSSMPY
jgi:hypothetical protein